MKIKNRRKFHRINFTEEVDLKFTDDTFDCCRIKNLSLGGMFVTGKLPEKETNKCHISIYNDKNAEKPRLRASATVIWRNEEGVGLKFTSMTFENYMLLLSTLINNSDQPAVILHEFPKKSPFTIENA